MKLVNIEVTPKELVALWNLRHADPAPAIQRPAAPNSIPAMQRATGKVSYNVLGEERRAKTCIEAFIDILSTLSNLDPSLPGRLAEKARATSRNHIARSQSEVYPRRPDLVRYSREFAPGWYVGTNIANREKIRILQLACEILRLKFGKDIVF